MKFYLLYDVGRITHAESCANLEEANESAEVYKEEGYVNVRILNEIEFIKFNKQYTEI